MPLFLIFFSWPTLAQENTQIFSHNIKGRDVHGHAISEQVTINENGQMTWITASKGFPCPSEAGKFSGTVSSASKQKILMLASQIANMPETETRPPGESFHQLLTYKLKNTQKSIRPKTSDKKFIELERELAFLKSSLVPELGISLKSRRYDTPAGVKLQATFSLLGGPKISVGMPATASEAFYLDNRARLAYAKPPAFRLITLDSNTLEYQLEFVFPKGYAFKSQALYYQRRILELKMDVLLCSVIEG
ncbi:MAG: hypothetical protein HYV97_11780 [Bdellovibrio sp.]|nr:hypothetical protein [Bdellovibrio sp.]